MNTSANNIAKQDHRLNSSRREVSCPGAVVLHKSENAWRPSCKSNYSIDEKEKLRRCVQGTLNKLTFQKFKILLAKIENLKFNKVEDLELLIGLIFENAIYEPQFSVLYANLSKELCHIPLCIGDGNGRKETFHDCLLTKCLNEFETWCIEQNQAQTTSGDLNQSERSVRVLFEEGNRKIKCRQIGIIRFIGELFNFDVVESATIHECISKLMAVQDNKSLEFACEFLKAAGQKLDEMQMDVDMSFSEENPMDVYFAQMQVIVDEFLANTRIRFMLQDVIELRINNWIPRRIRAGPKTIDEIHTEIELQYSRSD